MLIEFLCRNIHCSLASAWKPPPKHPTLGAQSTRVIFGCDEAELRGDLGRNPQGRSALETRPWRAMLGVLSDNKGLLGSGFSSGVCAKQIERNSHFPRVSCPERGKKITFNPQTAVFFHITMCFLPAPWETNPFSCEKIIPPATTSRRINDSTKAVR